MKTKIEIVDEELRLTRSFAAPRELVFAAWTEADRVQSWWGCGQRTAVESEVDLRVGGAYRHRMTIGGVGDCIVEGTFTEVDPPNRIAYTVPGGPAGEMGEIPDSTTTIEFFQEGESTLLKMTIVGLGGTPFENIVQIGWNDALDKLEARV